MPLITQAVNQEMFESFLVVLQGVIVQTYSATAPTNYSEGAVLDQASAGSSCVVDFRSGFYPPNGSATSGNGGYVPTTTATFTTTPLVEYCITGNIDYSFQFNV